MGCEGKRRTPRWAAQHWDAQNEACSLQVEDHVRGNEPLSLRVHRQGQTLQRVGPQQRRGLVSPEDHDGRHALAVDGRTGLPVLHLDAPVSTVASMSRTCWPSMLEMRSGHLSAPIPKPLQREKYTHILPDVDCPKQGREA